MARRCWRARAASERSPASTHRSSPARSRPKSRTSIRSIHREERSAQDGPLHSFGASPPADEALHMSGLQSRGRRTAERTGVDIGSGIGGFDVIEREHYGAAQRRPAQDLALLHSRGHREPGRRASQHSLRRQGPERGHVHRLHHQRPFHRRCSCASFSTAMPT